VTPVTPKCLTARSHYFNRSTHDADAILSRRVASQKLCSVAVACYQASLKFCFYSPFTLWNDLACITFGNILCRSCRALLANDVDLTSVTRTATSFLVVGVGVSQHTTKNLARSSYCFVLLVRISQHALAAGLRELIRRRRRRRRPPPPPPPAAAAAAAAAGRRRPTRLF
jgi:hypothetical protein